MKHRSKKVSYTDIITVSFLAEFITSVALEISEQAAPKQTEETKPEVNNKEKKQRKKDRSPKPEKSKREKQK